MAKKIPIEQPRRRDGHLCLRCDNTWRGRREFKGDTGLPKRCPRCRSPLWNTPRKKAGYGCYKTNPALAAF